MRERRCANSVWWGHLRESDHFEDPGLSRRLIFRRIFRKCDVLNWFMIVQVTGTCECGNEPSGSIKRGGLLD